VRQLDEGAKVRQPHDLALDDIADVMRVEELAPDARLQLLESERQPLIFRIDAEDLRLNRVALLQHLGRMLDLAPRHVRNVDEPVDAFFDFDERPELGEIADLAVNRRADWIFLRELVPRIGLDLLEAERNAPRARIDA